MYQRPIKRRYMYVDGLTANWHETGIQYKNLNMHNGIQNRHTIAWIGDHTNLRIRHQSKYTGCIKKRRL